MSQALQDIVRDLALQVANLTTQVAAIAAQHPPTVNATVTAAPRTKNYVQKPAPYDGKRADDARRFLSAFVIWAQAEKEGLSTATQVTNTVNGQQVTNTVYQPRINEWVSSCLTFLTGEAALWATPIIDQLNNAVTPFPSWNDFEIGRAHV